MNNYRSIVHYYFKPGMEDKGLHYLENELGKRGGEYGYHMIYFLQNEREKGHIMAYAEWNSIEEARKFQSRFEKKEMEMHHMWQRPPHHEWYHMRYQMMGKSHRAA